MNHAFKRPIHVPRKIPNRRFFAAKAEVAEAFVRVASRRNLTLYGLVSDILKKVVDLDSIGVSLDEVMEGFRLFKTSKEIGFVPVPENLWYETAEVSLKTDRKGTIARFSEAGEWIGKYALAKSQGKDPSKFLATCLAPLVHEASDFSIDGSETVRLRCVNARHPPFYTEPFSILLSKAIETLGYECESRTASRGMILLAFRKVLGLEQRMRGEILA